MIFAVLCNFVLLRVLRTCMAVIFVVTIVAILALLVFANIFLFARAGMLDVRLTLAPLAPPIALLPPPPSLPLAHPCSHPHPLPPLPPSPSPCCRWAA